MNLDDLLACIGSIGPPPPPPYQQQGGGANQQAEQSLSSDDSGLGNFATRFTTSTPIPNTPTPLPAFNTPPPSPTPPTQPELYGVDILTDNPATDIHHNLQPQQVITYSTNDVYNFTENNPFFL